jgi:hypothetical protein
VAEKVRQYKQSKCEESSLGLRLRAKYFTVLDRLLLVLGGRISCADWLPALQAFHLFCSRAYRR